MTLTERSLLRDIEALGYSIRWEQTDAGFHVDLLSERGGQLASTSKQTLVDGLALMLECAEEDKAERRS